MTTINGKEYEIGPRANLSWADLSGADLSEACLSGADLSWADLSGAKIGDGVISALCGRATRGDGCEFFMWRLEIGHIIRAGCRTFTLDQFREHVAAVYPGTSKAEETLAILAYLEGRLNASLEETSA